MASSLQATTICKSFLSFSLLSYFLTESMDATDWYDSPLQRLLEQAKSNVAPVRAKMRLDALHQTPLLSIFGQVRLFELLTSLRGLSPRLDQVQAKACKARQRLTLLLGDGARELHQRWFPFEVDFPNGLVHPQLSDEGVRLLGDSLPAVRILTIAMAAIKDIEIDQLLRLLRLWAGRLAQLRIVINCSTDQGQLDQSTRVQLRRIVASTKSLAHLKYLHLQLDDFEYIAEPWQPSHYGQLFAAVNKFFERKPVTQEEE